MTDKLLQAKKQLNDLVKKLRDYGTARETITLDDNGLQKAIRMIEDRDAACLKAADEIERLRARNKNLADCITEYLSLGGLFNPEMMEHDKVRDLLIDCRDALDKSQPDSKNK